MIREYVGFNAYEAACEHDTKLLGFSPADTAECLGITSKNVLRAIKMGFLDLCRIIRQDGSIQLVIPLGSIHQFKQPHRCQEPKQWQLIVLEADRLRGAWKSGLSTCAKKSERQKVDQDEKMPPAAQTVRVTSPYRLVG